MPNMGKEVQKMEGNSSKRLKEAPAETGAVRPFPQSSLTMSEQFKSKRRSEKALRENAAAEEEESDFHVVSSLKDIIDRDGGRSGFSQTPVLPPSTRAHISSSSKLSESATVNVPQSVSSLLQGVGGGGGRGGGRRSSTTALPNPPVSRGHTICAIAENVERETAIVSIDATTLTVLTILKQTNSMTYAETLVALEVLQPDEILMNEGRRTSELAMKVFNFYDNRILSNVSKATASTSATASSSICTGDDSSATMVKFINRSFFDQTKGGTLLRQSCRPSTYSQELLDEFIILAASNACLSYVQMHLGASFANHTLTLSFNSGAFKTKVSIDRTTIINLEVLTNARSAKGKGSLVRSIDNTVTSVGARLLRSNLLAPSTSPSTLNARLDLLDEFLADEVLFYSILELLGRLPDLDKTLAGLVLVPKGVNKHTVTAHHTAKGIASLVCLKAVLRIVPAIANALDASAETKKDAQEAEKGVAEGSDENLEANEGGGGDPKAGALAPTISMILRRPDLDEVLRAVEDIFTESTTFSRNTHAMRHQECFALRPNAHGMIDLLRKAFLANVDDIFTLADEYSEKYGFTVAVKESTARGYYLQIPAENESSLHMEFIQPVKSKKHICCTTNEVLSLNMRTQENVQDLLLLTHERIQEVLDFARTKYNSLASMCDAIALLDMVHSFSDCVASSRKVWCRPTISKTGSLAIRQGRFPIDGEHDRSRTPIEFVANDIFAGTKCNFSLVTGVNGGGKSTYLKQIGLIVLLGHIGSYVPAEEAFIPIRDQICTRIGCGDDFEHNISSFMMEMRETAFILRNLTPHSLVLVDELGRATSNEDGVAIAWSVAEKLLATNAFTFFVTHYGGLSKLAELYPNVSNISFGKLDTSQQQRTDSSGQLGNTLRIVNDYSLVVGSCQVSSAYGIEMASICGWPEHVVSKARSARECIVRAIGGDGGVLIDIGMAEDEEDARSRLADISAKLPFVIQEGAKGKSNLNEAAAKGWLQDVWKDFVEDAEDSDGKARRDRDDDDDSSGPARSCSEREKKRIELMISLVKRADGVAADMAEK